MRRYLQYPDYVAFKIDGVTEKNGTINAAKKIDSKREQQQKNGAEHGMWFCHLVRALKDSYIDA